MKVLAAILLAGLLLVGCGGDSEDTDPAAEPHAMTGMVHVTIAADGISFDGPVAAEPTTLMALNEDDVPHQVYLAKLNEGIGEKEVAAALKKGPDALFPIITIAGSFPGEDTNFGQVAAGESGQLTIDFPEGDYMVIDPETKGPPPFAIFEIGPAPDDEAAEPDADYEVEVGDFYFEFADPQPGKSTVKITNVGEQGHEVSVGTKGPDGEEAAFTFAPPPGGSLWTTFELESGEYQAACFIPDPETGKPHLKLGMKATFEVE
jgi:plastocyanin